MIPCISVENMRQSDAYTIEHLIPSLELMYRAAYGVYLAHQWENAVAIVAGSGNNGGDGYALACILKEHQIACTVFTIGNKRSSDSEFYANKAALLDIAILPFAPGCLDNYAIVVDCLLGTGFQGTVRQDYRVAIEEINKANAFVLSVDINSGMNGDSGKCEIAVQSDLTVTIGYVKHGLVSSHAGAYMKRLICADIGITLVKEEKQICRCEEYTELDHNKICCPPWLEIEPIKAF